MCLEAYEGSQVSRRAGDLLDARAKLRVCASEACPSIVRTDCVQWLGEVDRAVPSVVLEATTDMGNVFDVTVTVDGKAVAAQLDGRPFELDPGVHTFVFERAGNPTLEQKLIVHEGEQSRIVTAAWTGPKPARMVEGPALAAPAPAARPVPPIVYVLGAVGILGVADFVVLGIMGNSKKNELESSCSPFCSADEVGSVKTRYLIGDVGLGVGILALAGSVALFLSRPEKPVSRVPSAAFVPSRAAAVDVRRDVALRMSPSGVAVLWQGRF
jgi:hypothetical protein